MDIAKWPYKCQWGCRKGNKYYSNQIFKKRLKERYNFYKESCKNYIIIKYYDSANYKRRCLFYRNQNKEIAKVVMNEAPV